MFLYGFLSWIDVSGRKENFFMPRPLVVVACYVTCTLLISRHFIVLVCLSLFLLIIPIYIKSTFTIELRCL